MAIDGGSQKSSNKKFSIIMTALVLLLTLPIIGYYVSQKTDITRILQRASTDITLDPNDPRCVDLSGGVVPEACGRMKPAGKGIPTGTLIATIKKTVTPTGTSLSCKSLTDFYINSCTPRSKWDTSPLPAACKTNSTGVTLHLGVSGATKMAFFEPSSTSVDCTKAANSSFGADQAYAATKSWTLSSGTGNKKVCVRLKNASGSVKCGALINYSVPISCTSFSTVYINSCTPLSSWSASSRTDACRTESTGVTLHLKASNATKMAFYEPSNTSVNCADVAGTSFSADETYATTKSLTLSSGTGAKKVCVRLKNDSGTVKCGGMIEIVSATSTPTQTLTSTQTPTSTPEPKSCNETCDTNNDCQSGYTCTDSKQCRNPECTGESSCSCPEAVVTATPTGKTVYVEATSTPTPIVVTATPQSVAVVSTPTLLPKTPVSGGLPIPGIAAVGGGVLLLLLGLLL